MAPKCPVCDKVPTMRHIAMPVYGHFCLTTGRNVYWNTAGIWSPFENFINHVTEQSGERG